VADTPRRSQNDAQTSRVVVLPLTRADGQAVARLLHSAQIASTICADMGELCGALPGGGDSLIITEEAVVANAERLLGCLSGQPMWSELPVIVLSKAGLESAALAELLPRLGNVSVIERPVRMSTLLSLVRSSLRARQRQYQLRDFLREREQLLESERSARSDAERAGRIKDEFLATLSHELRTPLNAVLGWARVLRKSQGLSEEIANGLTVIERNARSQAQIIGDLLDMSSIISGKVRIHLEPVGLGALIAATVETVRPAAEAKAIRLTVSIDQREDVLQGDPSRLQQVFWNLLSNSVKFTPQGGEVTVTLWRSASHIRIEVGDNGEGIDPSFLPHIFDRFRQADASSARRHGGLGLGLSIVRQLVELHGGTIHARSDGPGTGSHFQIAFPVLAAPSPSLDSSGPWRSMPQHLVVPEQDVLVDLGGLKILVVDDEPDSRALLERLLLECHATVVTAASAEEAMLALGRDLPHLLVSDIGMPGTDGYAMMRQIRALQDERANIPAVAVTAYVRSEDQAMATRAGFQAHVGKPVDAGLLQSTLERLARQARVQAQA
jgi:signal transduction histidine kinase/ActR/RegA family two-component response regulator